MPVVSSSYVSHPKAVHVQGDGHYEDVVDSHPALAYIAKNQAYFDSQGYSHIPSMSDFYTENFTVDNAHGDRAESQPGSAYDAQHVWAAWASKFYSSPLEVYKHFFSEIIVLDSPEGYDLYWYGTCFANVSGSETKFEDQVLDPDFKNWDVAIPAAYVFRLVKAEGAPYGMKMSRLSAYKDTGVINVALERSGQGHLKTLK